MAGTAKTRTALENQSDVTFPSDTAEIVAVEHRQYNDDSEASALNIVDPAAQTVVSAMEFQKQITSIGGLGKLTTFAESIKADMQGVVPDLLQTGDWNFVKDPSVVDDEGLLNGLKFVFTASADSLTFSADFDVVGAEITSGERYLFKCWWNGAKFIVVIEALAGDNYIDFIPQSAPPAYKKGRGFYDEVEGTHTLFNDLEGTSLQVGEELRARLTNDTGFTLLDGVAVAVTGAVADKLQVELLNASVLDSSIRALGLVTLEALNGADSYIVRFGAVRNLNTAAFAPGDVLYADPATLGGLINVRPVAPFYPVRIGVCIISDALLGVIGVDTLAFNGTDTTVNIEGTLNGVVVETPLVEFYESGGNIFAEVTNQNVPAQNLAFILGGIRYLLDTTTGPGPNNGATAMLTPGADAETLFENFIYVWLNGGTPELKISTLSTPDTLAPIGKASIFDVTRTLTEGVYKWRRYNDAADNGVDDGFNRWLADATRDKLGTTYTSGIDATVTVNSTPSVKIATTAGVAMQAHKDAFTLQDGDSYWVYNDETNQAVYEFTDDLASIVETALGVSLAVNGAYYRLPVYGMQSSPSGGALAAPDKLIVTRPLGFYSTAEEALTDASNLDVAPNDILTEGVLFKLYTLVIGRTGGGGSIWEEVATLDDRTRLIGGVGGGGAAGGAGTDDKVRVTANDTTNSYLDDKLVVTSRLLKTTLNPGANEQLELDTVVHDYGIIYLTSDGVNTNPGTEEFPVLTLQKAVDLAVPLDYRIRIIGTYVDAGPINIPIGNIPGTSSLVIEGDSKGRATGIIGLIVSLGTVNVTDNHVIFKHVEVSTLNIIQTSTNTVKINTKDAQINAFGETIATADKTDVLLFDFSNIQLSGIITTPIRTGESSDILLISASTLTRVDLGRNCTYLQGAVSATISTLNVDHGKIDVASGGSLDIDVDFTHNGAIFVNKDLITISGSETDVTGEFADTVNKLDKVKTAAQTINSNVAVVGETISFTATPTFDFDVKGNVKKMVLTANVTTLTVANALDSGSYRVFLTEDGTGGHTLPTPDSSWGTELDNSAAFETGADAVNIIDLAVDPDGTKFYSVNVKP